MDRLNRRVAATVVCLLSFLAWPGDTADAQALLTAPQPGETYREYTYLAPLDGIGWRVTDPDATATRAADFLPNPVHTLGNLDLSQAVNAEALLDIWGGHVGTTGKAIRFNNNAFRSIPNIQTIPDSSPQCYNQQYNPVVDVDLAHLQSTGNIFDALADRQTCFNFNWGQWGLYTTILRVYYDSATKPHPTGTITSHVSGGTVTENAVISCNPTGGTGGIARVEFFAFYDGYDTDGDGVYAQYHESYFRNRTQGGKVTRNHVGTATSAPWQVQWDTTLVPDQAPGSVKLIARIQDNNGIWHVTPEVTGLTLARTTTVKLYKPFNVPRRMRTRDFQNTTNDSTQSNVSIPASDNLADATAAYLLVRTWNGIDGRAEPGEDHWTRVNGTAIGDYGEDHLYSYDVLPISPSLLTNGSNVISFLSESSHHGVDILWPGPAVLVHYDTEPATPPAAPTGLTATALNESEVQLGWNPNTETDLAAYSLFRSTSPGFTPGPANRIAVGLVGTSTTDTGLQSSMTYYYKLTATNTSGQESPPSGQAMATTLADTNPPEIFSVGAQSPFAVQVIFDEAVEETSAEDTANYGLANGIPIAINSATLDADQRTVTLATGQLPENTVLTLTVTGVLDLAPSPNAANDSATFEFLDQLLAHWKFDETSGNTAADSSGNNNFGTLVGPVSTPGTPDGSPRSLCFDGVNDYVDVGSMNVPGSALTISAWFRADSFNIGDARIISKADGVNAADHIYMLSTLQSGANQRLRCRLRTGSSTKTLVASSGNLQTDAWTLVTMTYDGSTLRLYKDAVQVGSLAATGSIPTFSSIQTAIGNQPIGAGERAFDGCIDDVRIYGRALSQQEIQELIVPTNQPPNPVADNYDVDEDAVLNVPAATGVLANDTDPTNDPFTAVLNSGPSDGALTLNADGSFMYTPEANFNGTDSFTYRAMDATGSSGPQTVTLNVLPQPDAPTAMADAYNTNEDTPLNVPAPGVLTNDGDVDGDPLQAVLFTDVATGTLALALDGSFTYTPAPNAVGQVTFEYTAFDGALSSPPATVTIDIAEVVDPIFANDDSYDATEDTLLSVSAALGVLANDGAPEGGVPSITAQLVTDAEHGDLALQSDGSFTYAPDPNYSGVDTFTYYADNGAPSNTATVTLTVMAAPDTPVAVDDGYSVGSGQTLTVSLPAAGVLGNDTDADGDSLTATVVSPPSDGSLTLNLDGTFTYMHNGGMNPTDTFTYEASDGSLTDTATVLINVSSVATGLFAHWPLDQSSGTAAPDVVGGRNGTHGAGTWDGPSHDGSSNYAVLNGVNDVITLPTFDLGGNEMTLACWFRADDFGQVDGRLISKASGVGTIQHLWMLSTMRIPFSDPSGDFFLRFRLRAGGQTTTLVANSGQLEPNEWTHAVAVYDGAQMRLYKDGVLVGATSKTGNIGMDPAVGVAIGNQPPGAGSRPFDGCMDDVRIYERALTAQEIEALATPNQQPQAPVAVDDSYITAEDTQLNVAAPGVLGNDSDLNGDPLTANLVSGPANGSLTLNADGSFTYTPDPGTSGLDSFVYMASDGILSSGPATVEINVQPVLDPPMAFDDAYATAEDTPLVVPAAGVLANDNDPEAIGMTAVLVMDVQHGNLTLNADGSFTYDPATDYAGPDSFTYQASNGSLSNIANVMLTVTPVNDAPQSADDSYSVMVGDLLTVALPANGVLGNDSDADGDPLTAAVETGPMFGTLTLAADGTFTYQHNGGPETSDTFTYRASDGTPGNLATVVIAIQQAKTGLIHWWKFDEPRGNVANDSAGSANGAITGATFDSNSADGAGSLLFDGVDDRVDLGTLDVPAGNAITIAAWFRADDFDIRDARIISKASGTSSAAHYWMMSTINDASGLHFLRFRLKTNGITSTLHGNNASGRLFTGVWTHAAMVYDGAEMRIYKDGVLVGSMAKTGTIDTNASVQATIGNQPIGAGPRAFDGRLDDIRIYDRALSEKEIQLLAD